MLQLLATHLIDLAGVATAASLAGTWDWTSVNVSVGAGGTGTAARGSLPVLYSSIQSVSILYHNIYILIHICTICMTAYLSGSGEVTGGSLKLCCWSGSAPRVSCGEGLESLCSVT